MLGALRVKYFQISSCFLSVLVCEVSIGPMYNSGSSTVDIVKKCIFDGSFEYESKKVI